MGKWNYGISCAEVTPMTAPLPLEGDLYDCMEKAVSYGYQGVEFHTRESYKLDLEKIKSIGQTSGAKICCIVSGRLYTQGGHGLLDETPKRKSGDFGHASIHRHGLRHRRGRGDWLAKGTVPPQGDRKIYLDRLAENPGNWMPMPGKRGQGFCWRSSITTKRIFSIRQRRPWRSSKNTARELLYSSGHLPHEHGEFNPYQAIRICGRKLGYLHVADNSRRYPGSGQLDFKRVFETLDEMGYDGWVTVECLPYPDRDTAVQKRFVI
jgi:hypothetical protein